MIGTTYYLVKRHRRAAVFAENVGKILAPISTGVDAFAKLKGPRDADARHGRYLPRRAPVPARRDGCGDLLIRPEVDSGGSSLCGSVGKIVGVIGPAVDAFAKLPIWWCLPRQSISLGGRSRSPSPGLVVSSRFQADAVAAAAVFAGQPADTCAD